MTYSNLIMLEKKDKEGRVDNAYSDTLRTNLD